MFAQFIIFNFQIKKPTTHDVYPRKICLVFASVVHKLWQVPSTCTEIQFRTSPQRYKCSLCKLKLKGWVELFVQGI